MTKLDDAVGSRLQNLTVHIYQPYISNKYHYYIYDI